MQAEAASRLGLILALCSIGGSMRLGFFGVLLLAFCVLTGCAATLNSKYRPPAGASVASATLVATTNSTGTMGRHYNFFLSEDNTCSHKTFVSLGGKLIAEDRQVLPPTPITANRPVSLVVRYSEGRAGMMRECGNVARFVPKVGRSYDIEFQVTNQGHDCAIAVHDVLSGYVALENSEQCYAQRKSGTVQVPNGKSLTTIIQVTP